MQGPRSVLGFRMKTSSELINKYAVRFCIACMSNHKRKGTKYDKCFGSDPEKYEPYVSPIKAKEIKKKYHKYYDKFDRSENSSISCSKLF